MRVKALCSDDNSSQSEYSHWERVNIPPERSISQNPDCPDCECDGKVAPVREITNTELRHDLQTGDTLVDKRGTTRYVIDKLRVIKTGYMPGSSL